MIGIAAIFAFTFPRSHGPSIVIILITSGTIGTLSLYALLLAIRIIADIWRKQVAVTEGLVRKTFREQMGRTWRKRRTYYYQINNLRFEVSQRSYNALIAGLPYRLYYTPRSKRMVGIEPLASLVDVSAQSMNKT